MYKTRKVIIIFLITFASYLNASCFEKKEVLGEITLVIKGIKKVKHFEHFNEVELKKDLSELINAGLNLSAASKYLAKKNNLKKSIIYDLYQKKN